MNIIDELKERGYFEQATFEDELSELLEKERVKFYIGFDATADSLTIGHFIQIMVMMRMQKHGHIPIALLGGGTTMIGDPSGRNDMRSLMTEETIDENARRFQEQMSRFLDFSDGNGIIENNKDWLRNLNFLEFARDIGTHFNVNQMLNLDIYKNRLEKGLTYFELSYMLLQSYDYLVLYDKHKCKLQMGGSDQWANILGGYDLVRKLRDDKVYAMTFKLLTKADGTKMGKSQKGAVWLDENKTSVNELFQYMRNVEDVKVCEYLLMLTFLDTEECKRLGALEGEKINEAKEILAYEVCKIIHGEEKAKAALEAARAVFEKGISSENMDTFVLEEGEIGLLDLLTKIGFTKSNSEARRLVMGNAISVNREKVTDPKLLIDDNSFKEGELILQKGKKNFVRIVRR
ncbi:tyrosine--tRNA ligase [Citroniella saccharovorans]|uniref:Tyrosine--tRNA ligase n=1 Tax=Citroniella saccharovorans TaxID=2053367 RepID=A0AAW9MVH2_9FIRM|nr:tyrosine--tRNA ligase [Citroniella saccharovorans]MEB3430196.1 tyrosine--tRNA ligase [Citroniella saccharovorans]